MLAARKKISAEPGKPAQPLFTTLKNGMQHLADTVASRLTPSAVLTNAPVQAVQREAESWVVSAGLQSDQFDSVIIALPAPAAAQVLRMASPDLSSELAAIRYASSITVGLGYDRHVRELLPPGFGFLVPRSEGKKLLAATFVHNKFPHRAPEDRALLRCFFAGRTAEEIWGLGDDQIVGIVRNELQQILGPHIFPPQVGAPQITGPQITGLRAEPLFARVYKWKSAMAQYGVGHLDRLDRIERLRRQLPGLALAGNAFRGIGVPDCVRSGTDAAKQMVEM
jgi:oxygen-dependent protoporphyrinogen oxidase